MNDQRELFVSRGSGFRPDFSRREPMVWVRELVILREFKPGDDYVIRRISLRLGLNILWARPRVGRQALRLGEPGISGHASGKTTFCRLLRHVLCEDHFGNDDFRQRVRQAFNSGWVVGHVILNAKSWLVCRPFAIGPHPFVIRDQPISQLFDDGSKREPLQTFLDELNRRVIEPLPVATFASSPDPIEWLHLIQWLCRDQECRFAGLTDFRHPSSNSESPEMEVEDRHFLFRSVIGLINTAEQEELERNKQLVAKRQLAEKRVPLLRHQANVAYGRLREELSDLDVQLPQELFIEAARRSLSTKEESLTQRIITMKPSADLIASRTQLAAAQAKKQFAENRSREIKEALEGLGKELQVLRGELSQKELDDYWKSKTSGETMCLEPLVRAVAFNCPLNIGRKMPEKPGKAALLVERNADAVEKILELRRRELNEAQELFTTRAKEANDAQTALDFAQTNFNDERDQLIEHRSAARTLLRQCKQAQEDQAEAADLEESLGTLEKQIRRSQERQVELREKQNQALTAFSETFDRVIKAVLGTDVDAKVHFRGRQVDPKINRRGDLTSAAIETLKILAFDLAALISSVEGRGLHPRLLIHDGPREADMASDLYQKLFLLARELEICFGSGRTPNFQYILTTTEPPPEEFQDPPWRLEPILDASAKEGRLLMEDL